jgi:UPF0755 protein
MRIVLVFMMLLMVSITGVAVLAGTTFRGGAEAVAGLADAARAQGQPAVATVAPRPPVEPSAQPAPTAPAATAAPRPTATPAPVRDGDSFSFVIQDGETTGSIAQRLAADGLVIHPALFRLWVEWRGAEGRLQAGEYELRRGMSMDEIVDSLLASKSRDVSIRFVEGQRLEEFAETLGKADVGIDPQRFLDLAQHGSFAYDFLEDKPPSASLEGYLFPDTYSVIPGKTTAEELIHQMLKRFGEAFPPALREQAQKNGFSVRDTVILASIVEREAQVADERPRIAAVLVNRLHDPQCLCVDATVQYAAGKSGDWWPVLRTQARTVAPESDYNTYTHAGLPPGPIANPGADALRAAADPEKTGYRFYVRDDIKNDGSHRFAVTQAEHDRNVRDYSRQ